PAAVAEAVAMLNGAGQHIGDRLDPPVRVPGKAAQVVLGPVVAEIVEEQEGIKLLRVGEAEGAVQLDAGALHRRKGGAGVKDGADRHGAFSCSACREYRARGAAMQPSAPPRPGTGPVRDGRAAGR